MPCSARSTRGPAHPPRAGPTDGPRSPPRRGPSHVPGHGHSLLPYAGSAAAAAVVPSPRRPPPPSTDRAAGGRHRSSARAAPDREAPATSPGRLAARPVRLLRHRRRRPARRPGPAGRRRGRRDRGRPRRDAARRAWAGAPLVLVGADLRPGRGRGRAAAPRLGAGRGWSRQDNGVWQAAAPPAPRRCIPAGRRRPGWSTGWPSRRRPSTGRVPSRSSAVEAVPARRPSPAPWPACGPRRHRRCSLTPTRSAAASTSLLGVEAAAGLRWPDLACGADGRIDRHELTAALPARRRRLGAVVAPRRPAELPPAGDGVGARCGATAVTTSVVVDLPRALDPAAEPAAAAADVALLVVPAEIRATAAAGRVAATARGLHRRPAGRGPRARTRRADRRTGRRRARAAAGRLAGAGARAGGRPRTRRAAGPVRPRDRWPAVPRAPGRVLARPGGGWRDRRPSTRQLVDRVPTRLARPASAPAAAGSPRRCVPKASCSATAASSTWSLRCAPS